MITIKEVKQHFAQMEKKYKIKARAEKVFGKLRANFSFTYKD